MKNIIKISFLFILSALIITACEKEEVRTPEFVNTTTLENRDASVWICHKSDGNNPNAIWVDENSVEAHLGHGDVLLDADGDGYTAVNNCEEGTMDDCDDNDASINPGAEEICGDGIDNNCDGNVDEDCFSFDCADEISGSADYSSYSCGYYDWDDYPYGYDYGSYTYRYIDWSNGSEYFYAYVYDLRDYNDDYYCDYYIGSGFYNWDTGEECYEEIGTNCYGEESVTEEQYLAALAELESLAAELGIEDSCSDGVTSDGADSANAMQTMPDKLKELIEERKGLLTPQK